MPSLTPEPITPDLIDDLVQFLAGFPDDRRGLDYWQWRVGRWWVHNPAAPGQPWGFHVRDQGRIVGVLGCIPGFFSLGGARTVVINATTWRVLPSHRDASLKLLFALMGAARDTFLLCTTPSPVSVQVLTGLQFLRTPMPDLAWSVRTTHRRPLALRLGEGWPARAGALALDRVQAFRLGRLRLPAGYEVAPTAQAGPEFDDLWRRTSQAQGNTTWRDAATVGWLYLDDHRRRKTLLTCRRQGRLTGFTCLSPVIEPGERGLYALDVWSDRQEDAALEALLKGALLWAWEQGYDHLTVRGYSEEVAKAMAGLPGARCKSMPHRHYWRARADLMQRLGHGPTYLVDMQGDVGL